MIKRVDNCYQCAYYHTCYFRIKIEDLLDMGHNRTVLGGKSVFKNSIPSPFLRMLAEICKVKEQQNDRQD